jgi:hypothetical protein
MRWVMTITDHSTGLTYLCALPRKRHHLIAYKLKEIFGIIGYPKIFHIDNWKEFTAKVVLKVLLEMNPLICAVTGRPNRPPHKSQKRIYKIKTLQIDQFIFSSCTSNVSQIC